MNGFLSLMSIVAECFIPVLLPTAAAAVMIYAQNFSNDPGSHQSSLGFYTTGDTYDGKNGYSLRLQGRNRELMIMLNQEVLSSMEPIMSPMILFAGTGVSAEVRVAPLSLSRVFSGLSTLSKGEAAFLSTIPAEIMQAVRFS